MGLFGIGVAASLLLILAHDRPFTGELSVTPDPLLQVMPELKIRSARDQALIPLFSSISYSTAPARLTGMSSAIPAMLGEL